LRDSVLRDFLLPGAAAVAAFGLSAAGPFHFDDYAIFNDPALLSPLATRPLTNLTFWLNELAGGRNPAGYHLVNLALHVATVIVLRMTLARVIPATAALFAALVFAVHPIQTEAVNYVFARGTLLMTVLCVCSLKWWLSGRHWTAVVWFAAALLAKEECVAFPIFLLLLHLSVSRNTKELRAIGAMLLLALAAGFRVLWATAAQGSGAGIHAGIGSAEYFSLQGVAITRYFRLLVVPWGFTIDPELAAAGWMRAAAWAIVFILLCLGLRRFARARWGFWLIGGIVLLLPSSSIFPANDLAADRRMYLPMIAFSAVAGYFLIRLDRRAAAAILVVLAVISIRYSYIWDSEWRLWTEAVHESPGKVRPLIQQARAAPEAATAIAILDRAEKLAPRNEDVATEKGRLLLTLDRPAEALAEFGRALALAPDDAIAMNNRGAALLALNQTDAAQQDFKRALQKNPCLFNARLNLKRMGIDVPAAAGCRYTREQNAQLAQ
jgi:protein O-mannosyl-transferase